MVPTNRGIRQGELSTHLLPPGCAARRAPRPAVKFSEPLFTNSVEGAFVTFVTLLNDPETEFLAIGILEAGGDAGVTVFFDVFQEMIETVLSDTQFGCQLTLGQPRLHAQVNQRPHSIAVGQVQIRDRQP